MATPYTVYVSPNGLATAAAELGEAALTREALKTPGAEKLIHDLRALAAALRCAAHADRRTLRIIVSA